MVSGSSGSASELPGMDGVDLHNTVFTHYTSVMAAGELEQSVGWSEDRASNRSKRRGLALYL